MGLVDPLAEALFRRSLDFLPSLDSFSNAQEAGNALVKRAQSGEAPPRELWVIVATIVLFAPFYLLLQYTLRHVIPTLAMIETPSTQVTVSASIEDEEQGHIKISDKEAEAEAFLGNSLPAMTVTATKPITSKIRTTIKHITSQAGWKARWRGMGYGIVWGLLAMVSMGLFKTAVPHFPGKMILCKLTTAIVTAPAHMIWTHATIAMPGKGWKGRWAAARGSFKTLALPNAVYAGVELLVIYIAHGVVQLLRYDASQNKPWMVARILGALFVIFATTVFVILPAHVQLVRVEASLLPDDDETIVPFDRTFGGKVVPKVLGGSGSIGFLDAWRSFNREARIRVVKVYAKVFLVDTAVMFIFTQILVLEFLALGLDKTLVQFMEQAQNAA